MSDILDQLPYRYPFLLLDKVVECEPDSWLVALKNVSINEPYFQGNLPDFPVMPGSLVLEAQSQACHALLLSRKDLSGCMSYFASIEKADFHRQVFPGDQLRVEVEVVRMSDQSAHFKTKALVDGNLVCEATLGFSLSIAPSKPKIHPTASVHPSAVLGKDVEVGPYSIIKEHVSIGDRTKIKAHVLIEKWTKIGEDNQIHFGSVIGSEAQDAKYGGEESWVIIGDRNQFREYVTVNRATGKDAQTVVGSDNMFLTNVHIGHNCQVGSHITLANMVHVGGHVSIEDRVTIGGLTGVHQFVRIGWGCMVGGYSRLIQDLPPFMLSDGNPAYVRGLNAIGLRRNGIKGPIYEDLKNAYKILYRSQVNLKQAIEQIQTECNPGEKIDHLLDFVNQDTSRGISRKSELVDS